MLIILLLCIVALVVVGVVYGRGVDNIDRHTVSSFDLNRFMGKWYEIARFDHSFERGLVEVCATYRLLDNGRVLVTNRGTSMQSGRQKQIRGKARLTSEPGRLQVSFFWIFYSDYNIMELDENYGWVLVGGRSPKYLWILSRTPSLPNHTLNRIIRLAEQRGYKSDQLLFIDQKS